MDCLKLYTPPVVDNLLNGALNLNVCMDIYLDSTERMILPVSVLQIEALSSFHYCSINAKKWGFCKAQKDIL